MASDQYERKHRIRPIQLCHETKGKGSIFIRDGKNENKSLRENVNDLGVNLYSLSPLKWSFDAITDAFQGLSFSVCILNVFRFISFVLSCL